MKKFIAGFVLAAVLFTALPIGAAIEEFILYRADYNVLVDGKVYNDPDLPTLNYKGSTYIPLRKVADVLGVKLDWNATLNQAEISKSAASSVEVTPTPEPTQSPSPTPVPTIAPVQTQAPDVDIESIRTNQKTVDGLDVYEYEGEKYVFLVDVGVKYVQRLDWDKTTKTWSLIKDGKVTISNIDAKHIIVVGDMFVKIEYYMEHIYPLVK